jgi:hypothetical protein
MSEKARIQLNYASPLQRHRPLLRPRFGVHPAGLMLMAAALIALLWIM